VPAFDTLGEVLHGAASLIALAAVPPLFSPAPPPAANAAAQAAISVVLLAAIIAGSLRFRAKVASRDALVGAALMIGAVAAAIACAAVFRGDRGPLGRGTLWVAIPLWGAIAALAGTVAERRLGESFRHKRLAAAVIAVCAGASLLAASSRWLFSPSEMWWEALRKDPGNVAAVEAVIRAPLQKRDVRGAIAALDRCLAVAPGSCACLARRSELASRAGGGDQALVDARAAVAACPNDPAARAALVAALAIRGDAVEAEHEARVALAAKDDPRFHYALALAYDRQGKRAEAMAEARRAVDGGAGRDAAVLLAMLAINTDDLDTAEKVLTPVVKANPADAEAQYDLGLVAHRKNLYNPAREHYLAALRANPAMIEARFNLALLTLSRGVTEEAKHHAKKLAEIAPNDPRNADLARRIAAAPPPKK
jgi:tetratricopeptide (TPR) repeat protein